MRRTTMAVLAALVVCGTAVGCRREQKVVAPPPRPVRVAMVENYTSRDGVPYSASIRAATQVELAFKVNGYVERIHQVKGTEGRNRLLQEGDLVTRNTVLAQVRPGDYEARLGQARAQQAETQAAQETAAFQLAAA